MPGMIEAPDPGSMEEDFIITQRLKLGESSVMKPSIRKVAAALQKMTKKAAPPAATSDFVREVTSYEHGA